MTKDRRLGLDGLAMLSSRGDKTAIELFLAGARALGRGSIVLIDGVTPTSL